MRLLVIGAGGREHTLVHTFHRQGHTVYCIPGNPGTGQLSAPLPEEWESANFRDFSQIAAFVEKEKIDLTVVGSEEFLAKGIADYFIERGLMLFGPTREAALFESSKVWAKAFMTEYGIPTARYRICHWSNEAQSVIHQFDVAGSIIEPSGLTGGKGVVCCDYLVKQKRLYLSSLTHNYLAKQAQK